ncbi:MAG: substrate-binding domain-containing protein [Candidatus Limnocylindrales bacterium]|jgi:ABC-type sugar transport system substrate-binding protein
MHRRIPIAGLALSALAIAAAPVAAQDPSGSPAADGASGAPIVIPAEYVSPEAQTADTPVDTSAFAKEGPWKLCVSAGYLTNSWVVFALQHIRHQASLEPRYEPEIVVTDANFDPNKQIGDIADLINQGCEAILYWPIDDTAIEPGLEQAVTAGIPTVNVGGGYTDLPGIVSNAYIDQYELGVAGALKLVEALGGQGTIVSMLPIAGTTAAVDQDKALRDVLAANPGVELLDTQNGDWNRAKAKELTETWLQRYPTIDGVFSPAGQMSAGVAEAFDEAGRLGDVVFSPGDEYNGWLKWIAAHPESNGGLVTFPPAAGAVGVEQMTRILSGEEVTKGIHVPSVWYAPEEAAALADAEAPDDWWANELPAEFLPQS